MAKVKKQKGEPLRSRVRLLFQKAGFQTKPKNEKDEEVKVSLSSGKVRPLDIVAKAEGIEVLVECTGERKFSVTKFVHDKAKVGKAARIDKVLLVITGKQLTKNDTDYIRNENMEVWTEKEISYYEAIVAAIGKYTKYEIIYSLGLKTEEEKNIHNVYALRLAQPLIDSTREVFVFSTSPEFLLKTSVIFRRARGEAGTYQRMLRKRRLPKIANFVSRPDAIFPLDIIVALGDRVIPSKLDQSRFRDVENRPITIARDKASEVYILQIPMEYGSLEVIDGQHRLFGFARVNDEKVRKDFNLLVAGIRGLSLSQKRDVFVSINATSTRMDPNLVLYLKYTEDESECQANPELMAIKIAVELNKVAPFKDKIRLLDIGYQKITLTGFSGYVLRTFVGPKGILRKYYPDNCSEDYIKALRLYFSAVREVLEREWDNPEKYIIATNRGMSAFLRLLRSLLNTVKGKLTHEEVKKYLLPLKGFNFDNEHLKGIYIGTAGWKKFHEDLVKKIREEYPEFAK